MNESHVQARATAALILASTLFAAAPARAQCWSETTKVTQAGASPGDNFGESVAIAGDTALAGAFNSNANGSNSGAAYLFGGAPSPVTIYCTAGFSESGCQARIDGCGTPSATAPSGFSVVVSTVEGNKRGLVFTGVNGRQANAWGNGTSFQCVVPPVARGVLLVAVGTQGFCDATYAYDLNARWTSHPSQNPGAGATAQSQFWYRDPFNTSSAKTSLSDALEYVVGP